jgi:hypothetical protein
MGFFRRPPVIRGTQPTGLAEEIDPVQINPTPTALRPMGSYNGSVTYNPNIGPPGPYARDIDNTPIIFNRFGTRWGDIQLKNGLANGVASGKIWGYRGEGWYDLITPTIPGQTRQYGKNFADFVPKGPAPSQWQNFYNQTAGSQPMYPGGPGQIASPLLYNPGSGG